MALALDDKWIWDFWLVEDDRGLFHVFYLQAPKSLGDPDLRHWNVSIGHAVSPDLTDWTVKPDVMAPSPQPAWDDKSTWTGSVIQHNGRWYLFYTGTSHAEEGLVQRVGMAWSDDLEHWEKHPEPLIEADSRWYERLGDMWFDEAWRDPWVFLGDDGYFHALITARSNTGSKLDRGCVAHARSTDLFEWEVCEPITTPGGFGQLEVPQVHEIDGRHFLLFCCDDHLQSDERRAESGGGTGTFYMSADGPLGPFAVSESRPLEVDIAGSAYAGRMIDCDGVHYLSWCRNGPDGAFVGELSDPRKVLSTGEDIELS